MRKYEKHGMEKTRIYRIWKGMKNRCLNKNTINYKYYGGRSIGICDRWVDSFLNFYSDMGNPPTEKHQLDRINTLKNYTPSNCRWLTAKENNQNRRDTKLTLANVKTIRRSKKTPKQLAVIFSVSISHIRNIRSGVKW